MNLLDDVEQILKMLKDAGAPPLPDGPLAALIEGRQQLAALEARLPTVVAKISADLMPEPLPLPDQGKVRAA